jgi:Bacterial regulatory helix-turn-helix protein, lysR family
MDTNVLKTFIAVCEYSGFSAAAKELGYTQSTVSSQIKQLEKELDVRLFDRYYHKINLTEKGVLVLQQARNILKAQAKMLDSLNSAESIEGEIRLSMSSSVCSRYFKNDFLRFHHQYPEIKVEITENGTEQMFDKLRKNETDLVLLWTGIFMIRILLFVLNRKNRFILLQRLIILLLAVHGN